MNAAKQKKAYGEDSTVAVYFRDIAGSQGLPTKKEAELSRRIRNGDKKARDILIQANLRFVVRVARQYQNQGLPLADLINEGNVGLIKAAQKFDGKKSFRFISYAVWWIRQQILQALADQSRIVKLPLNRVNQIYKIRRLQEKLEQKNMRAPSYEELNSEGLTKDYWELYKLQNMESNPVALDAPTGLKSSTTYMDKMPDKSVVSPDNFIETHALHQEAEKLLSRLDKREREILERYFGFNHHHAHTLGEIGEHMNLTRERVRQIKERATNKLQAKFKRTRGGKAKDLIEEILY